MSPTDPLREEGLVEFPYGSVWLVGGCDPGQLSQLALHALGTADAVIHDPGVSREILELVQPPRYREAALPPVAIERTISLAKDGWRVVRLVEGNPFERHDAIECAANLSENSIPFRVISTTDEPFIGGAPIAVLTVCKARSARRTDPQTSKTETTILVVSIVSQRSEGRLGNGSALSAQRRQAPLGFSMSGLAG
jgi:Tetrapyrrole (Corrin/Porphyrin) Methylases